MYVVIYLKMQMMLMPTTIVVFTTINANTLAKDPAFLFYSQDFHTGTSTMPFEDRGKYITILCIMHQQGRLKEETIRFLVGSVSDMLRDKFKVDGNGLWYNERLEAEIQKRAEFTESRRNNGLKGGRPKASAKPNGLPSGKASANHMGTHMENENIDGINNINESNFSSIANAYMLMSGNYHDTEPAKTILSNNGWPGVTDSDVRAILHHFLETQVDIQRQDSDDIRLHWKRWVNKQDTNKLRSLSKNILENHARRRQGSG